MEIFIRCTINEEQLQEGLKQLNCTEQEFIDKVGSMLNESVVETLEDNEEIFSEIAWSINSPLP